MSTRRKKATWKQRVNESFKTHQGGNTMNRRDFLKGTSIVAGAVMAHKCIGLEDLVFGANLDIQRDGMIYRQMGSTGEEISIIGLGGSHIGRQSDPKDSIQIIRAALDQGINFMDNSWDYNNGESEGRMGKALQVTLTEKNCGDLHQNVREC
jgi:hypothetical protein